MARSIVIAGVFFLVGGALGFTLAQIMNDADQVPPEKTPATMRVDAPTDETKEPSSLALPAKKPAAAATPPATPELLGESTAAPVLKGDGKITGRVLTDDGEPVEGALVRAMASPSRSRSARRTDLPPNESLEEVVRAAATRFHREQATRAESRTNGEGRFTIDGIGEGYYRVQAWAEGYRIHALGATRARAGDTIAFTARPVFWQSVQVMMPNGQPADEATVEGRFQGRIRRWNWSRDCRDIELAAGSHTISAMKEETGLTSSSKEIDIRRGEPRPAIVLQLRGHPSVIGRVLDETHGSGSPTVWLLKHEGGPPPSAAVIAKKGARQSVHDLKGRFRFSDLAPGLYFIGAGRYHDRAEVVEQVHVVDRPVTHDLRIPPPDARDYVLVRVFRPDGKPLTGLRQFRTRVRGPQTDRSRGASAIANHDGSYLVPNPIVEPNLVGTWRYFVQVWTPRYGYYDVEYFPGRDREVVIRITEPAFLVIDLTGNQTNEGPEYAITIYREDLSRAHSTRARSKGDGQFEFGPTKPGPCTVVFQVVEDRSLKRLGESAIVLAPGENRVSIPIPALYTLMVQLHDGASLRGRLQEAGNTGVFGVQEKADERGQLVFKALKAGDYLLTVHPHGRMRIRVPAGGVVQFVGQPLNALRVTISDAAGPFAQAGLRNGDLIIGVDGKAFRDMAEIQASTMRARSKRTQFTVLRDGQEFVLALEPELWRNIEKSGGRVEPATR